MDKLGIDGVGVAPLVYPAANDAEALGSRAGRAYSQTPPRRRRCRHYLWCRAPSAERTPFRRSKSCSPHL
jgi:hypothetical protein